MEMNLDYINISELSDMEVAAHMRQTNYEKFKSLVRMHLSFELDLNTDEFDLPCHEIIYEDKGKLKKWNRLSKKHKHNICSGGAVGCATSAKHSNMNIANSPNEGLQQHIDSGFMFHLIELKDFLLHEKNITQEGLFRKTGSISRQNELRNRLQYEKPLSLAEEGYSAHDCATVFKSYIAELPEPLLTDAHYPAHLQIAPLCVGSSIKATNTPSNSNTSVERQKREQHLLSSVQLLLLLLPDDNRQLLQHIIEMLSKVSQHVSSNKMGANNLATLFSPHLICPRNLPPEALHFVARKMSSIIAYMILRGLEIFEVPAKLATDIRAYYLERKRKKTMSPEQMLDESISDVSTVNTVYTFVNRELTAAAHHTNTTETELAQLYAHIHSLPESSRKRRLIKQFNKQNGQGTPLHRLKETECAQPRSAKSLGDTIKKRIFQKAMMSRTPKRPAAPTMPSIETPNMASIKNPKMRVLFQTPTATSSNNSPFIHHTTHDNSNKKASQTNMTTPFNMTNTAPNTPHINKKYHASSSSTSAIKSEPESSLASSTNCSVSSGSSDTNSNSSSAPIKHTSGYSISAPVSRQTSNELDNMVHDMEGTYHNTSAHQLVEQSCCGTPLKLLTDAAKQLISSGTCGGGGSSVAHFEHGTICEKKTVVWQEQKLYDINEYSNPCTPTLQQQHATANNGGGSDLKSRYKSEPNLSRLLREKLAATHDNVEANAQKACCKSLTRKLMKGVSMSNLKFGFATPETTRRLVRSVSTTLKKHNEPKPQQTQECLRSEAQNADDVPLLQQMEHTDDLDDFTFEDDPNDHIDDDDNADDVDDEEEAVDEDEVNDNDDEHEEQACSYTANTVETIINDENANDEEFMTRRLSKKKQLLHHHIHSSDDGGNSNSNSSEMPTTTSYQHLLLQQSGLYRNLNLITSTPSLLLGRRSMSPITKSTQRMPKYMQESIMTPRSRKPVMDLANLAPTLEKNSNDSANVLLVTSNENSSNNTSQSKTHENVNIVQSTENTSQNVETMTDDDNALTKNFKHYLLKRSVYTASPVDSSFSSQPDDFNGEDDDDATENDNNEDVDADGDADADTNVSNRSDYAELNASLLSPSLLYCLDGNRPDDVDEVPDEATATVPSTKIEQLNESSKMKDETDIKQLTKNQIKHQAAVEQEHEQAVLTNHNRLATNPFIILNNARKRAATQHTQYPSISPTNKLISKTITSANTITTTTTPTTQPSPSTGHNTSTECCNNIKANRIQNLSNSSNKENHQALVESYLLKKKLLINEYPGETDF